MYQVTNTRCLIEAAKRLNLKCRIFDENGNLVEIKNGKGKLFFANYSTPFNSDSFVKISRDKHFAYQILKDVILMPKTAGFVDPEYDADGEVKLKGKSLEMITAEIAEQFDLPVVLKPRSLSKGCNFAVCCDAGEIAAALRRIYAKNQYYDYLALAQEYIKPSSEYRVVVFKNEIMLIYSVKKEIKDEAIRKELKKFIKPIFEVLPIGFAGLDIIFGENGEKYLLEINAEPGFANFVGKNGTEPVIEMYCKILKNAL